jgi:hypothetical protein
MEKERRNIMKEQLVVQNKSSIIQPIDTDIIIRQYTELQRLYKTVMQENVHYGAPFPGSKKKSLLKPGAELLCALYQLDIQTENIQVNDLGSGHREYVVTSVAYHRPSGMRVGSGEGLASTMEGKYRYRQARLKCPRCDQETIIQGKKEYGGGWVCWKKGGGCGAKFEEDDKSIMSQERGRIENPDIADIYNTVLKMAKKRSAVDCVLWSTAASSFFTQDGEDQSQYSERDFPEITIPTEEDEEDLEQTQKEKQQSVGEHIAKAVREKRETESQEDLERDCEFAVWLLEKFPTDEITEKDIVGKYRKKGKATQDVKLWLQQWVMKCEIPPPTNDERIAWTGKMEVGINQQFAAALQNENWPECYRLAFNNVIYKKEG